MAKEMNLFLFPYKRLRLPFSVSSIYTLVNEVEIVFLFDRFGGDRSHEIEVSCRQKTIGQRWARKEECKRWRPGAKESPLVMPESMSLI